MKTKVYINPLSLLEKLNTKTKISKAILNRARKRIMAEFELSENPEIEMAGHRFDKTAFLDLFEQLEDKKLLSYHNFVLQYPTLGSFLSEGDKQLWEKKHWQGFEKSMQENEGLRQFLGTYFAWQYSRIVALAFRKGDWEQVTLLTSRPLPFSLRQTRECYRALDRHLILRCDRLNELRAKMKNSGLNSDAVLDVSEEFLIESMNQLPDSFEANRNAYARALEELAIVLHNEFSRTQLAKYVIRQGLKLKLSPDSRGRLEYMLSQLLGIKADTVFDEYFPIGSGDKSEESISKWVLGGVAVAAVALWAWFSE